MLADYQLLLSEIGTSVTVQNLNIPRKAKLIEAIANPKQRMKEAVHKAFVARSRRRQEVDIVSLYEVMGEHISLDRLSQVPSYKQFCHDLTATLKSLNLLQ